MSVIQKIVLMWLVWVVATALLLAGPYSGLVFLKGGAVSRILAIGF